MIFIIPVILGAAAVVSTGAGIGFGAKGINKINEAKKIGKNAESKYKESLKYIQLDWELTQLHAEKYGRLQLNVKAKTIGCFIQLLKRIGQEKNLTKTILLAQLKGYTYCEQTKQYIPVNLEAQKLASGGSKAVATMGAAGVAGAAASQSAIAAAALFGTASTGTAIGGLSGAAAWNATLAWLGGGALAAGGGGMALGTIMLGGIALGPGLAVGGFMLSGQGDKAITKAKEYEAKVNKEIGNINQFKTFLQQVKTRIQELQNLVENLNRNAVVNLNLLEYLTFNEQKDINRLKETYLLIQALAEITTTPILDKEGNFNPAILKFQEKYKEMAV